MFITRRRKRRSGIKSPSIPAYLLPSLSLFLGTYVMNGKRLTHHALTAGRCRDARTAMLLTVNEEASADSAPSPSSGMCTQRRRRGSQVPNGTTEREAFLRCFVINAPVAGGPAFAACPLLLRFRPCPSLSLRVSEKRHLIAPCPLPPPHPLSVVLFPPVRPTDRDGFNSHIDIFLFALQPACLPSSFFWVCRGQILARPSSRPRNGRTNAEPYCGLPPPLPLHEGLVWPIYLPLFVACGDTGTRPSIHREEVLRRQ